MGASNFGPVPAGINGMPVRKLDLVIVPPFPFLGKKVSDARIRLDFLSDVTKDATGLGLGRGKDETRPSRIPSCLPNGIGEVTERSLTVITACEDVPAVIGGDELAPLVVVLADDELAVVRKLSRALKISGSEVGETLVLESELEGSAWIRSLLSRKAARSQ